MPSNLPIPTDPGGCLYVVSTPIGNLQDITLRALQVLAEVDVIAAEDTRHTRKLLAAHHIQGRLISYHEHNEVQRTPQLIERIQAGERLALVTNAGTPMVSDPGYRLVCAACQQNLRIVPVPGVSAAVTALSVCGLPTDSFTFVGFPARAKTRRLRQLKDLAGLPHTLIFYQSPLRLNTFLRELIDLMGDRRAALAREMTKLHEEFIRGPLSHILAVLGERSAIKGECVLLVEGAGLSAPAEPQDAQWTSDLREGLHSETPLSQVVREIALRFGLPKKTVYDAALRIKVGGD